MHINWLDQLKNVFLLKNLLNLKMFTGDSILWVSYLESQKFGAGKNLDVHQLPGSLLYRWGLIPRMILDLVRSPSSLAVMSATKLKFWFPLLTASHRPVLPSQNNLDKICPVIYKTQILLKDFSRGFSVIYSFCFICRHRHICSLILIKANKYSLSHLPTSHPARY